MEKYTEEWFRDRAHNAIHKIHDGVFDYSDSLLLYTSSGSQVYKQLQETDTPYFRLVTRPEREYLQKIAKDVVDTLPNDFEYIDLGPGTENKEQFFFDELKKQGKSFTYVPVDISEHFLDLAVVYATNQAVPVRKVRSSFEELPDLLGKPARPRFVSLGLTFSNYEPEEILALLRRIAGEGGYVFINTQMRDRVDTIELKKVYQDEAVHLADGKLLLIGLDPVNDVTSRVVDDGFKVSCFVLKCNKVLEDLGVRSGDRIIVFQSLRYTKESFINILQELQIDYTVFDRGDSFIASLIQT